MTRAFKYRLDRILRMRSRTEQEARRALGEVTSRLALARQTLANAVTMKETMEAEGGQLVATGKSAALPLQAALCRAAEESARVAREQVEELTGQVERARRVWEEARRAQRSLQRLRERRHEEWWRQVLGEEAREMDEIGRVRYLRQRGEES